MNHVQFGAKGEPPLKAARAEWFICATEQTLFAMYSGAADAYEIRASGIKCVKYSMVSGKAFALGSMVPDGHQNNFRPTKRNSCAAHCRPATIL